MVQKKRQSKRESFKMKYKKERRIKEFHRKARRLARASGVKKAPKKDPGIPNLWPFKQSLLEKVQQAKEAEKQLSEQQRAAKRRERERRRAQALAEAEQSATAEDEFTRGRDLRELNPRQMADVQKRRWYRKELNQVLEQADVILEVLDARDPEGCRSPEVERKIINSQTQDGSGPNKKLILVLNKIDLVPPEVVEAWVKRLRREFPVIAFRANTQKQKILSRSKRRFHGQSTTAEDMSLSTGMNRDKLIHALKQYCLTDAHGTTGDGKRITKFLRVGVIGYPNVGKSSIINTLKGRRSAATGHTPGVTKSLQRINLGSDIELIDSPGVLFSAGGRYDAELVLRNCLRVEQLEDPVEAVELMVERFPQDELTKHFQIPGNWETAEEFIACVAIQKGKMGPGGVPNLLLAARAILADWNSGKIPYYTVPGPDPELLEEAMHTSERVVSAFSPEFNLQALDALNQDTLTQHAAEQEEEEKERVQQGRVQRYLQMQSAGPILLSGEEEEEEEEGDGMAVSEDEEGEDGDEPPQLVQNKQFALGETLPKEARKRKSRKAGPLATEEELLLDERNDLLDNPVTSEEEDESEDDGLTAEEGKRPAQMKMETRKKKKRTAVQAEADDDPELGQQVFNVRRNRKLRKQQREQQAKRRKLEKRELRKQEDEMEIQPATEDAEMQTAGDDYDWSSFQ